MTTIHVTSAHVAQLCRALTAKNCFFSLDISGSIEIDGGFQEMDKERGFMANLNLSSLPAFLMDEKGGRHL